MATADAQTDSFATTHWSIVLAGTKANQPGFKQALSALVLCYRPAIVAFVRAYYRCDEPEAEDITQTFLTRWAENGMPGVSPDGGRFRSYLRGALRHFIQNWRRARHAQRRGGDRTITSVDAGDATMEVEDTGITTPDEAFDNAYRCELFSAALAAMSAEYQAEGRLHYMEAFQRRYVFMAQEDQPPTYRELADTLGVTVSDVTNWLAHARRRLRDRVTQLVRQSVAEEASFREEMDALCGGKENKP